MAMTTAQQTDAYRFFSIAFDAAPGVTYMNQLAEAYGAGMTTKQIVNVFTTKEQFTSKYPNFLTTEVFATNLINNVVGTSATAEAKTAATADVVAAINSGMTRGDVIFQIFSNLAAKAEDDATWGDTAQLLANKVAVAQYVTETQLLNTTDLAVLAKTLSAVTAATDTSTPAGIVAAITAGNGLGGNDYGVSLQLTRDRDSTDPTAKQTNQTTNIIASTDGNDFYSGTVDPANSFNNTVNNDDYIDGGKGVDTLTLALLGNNTSNARVKNVENLVLGTNVSTTPATTITYDLNINAGGQQTTGYQTIAADRIIAGEVLTVANVFKGTADAALPKLIWDNASNTTVAGVVNYNYLSGQTTGTADTQAIDLRSVNAGVLNIAAGIETFSVTSGTGINPVLNAPNAEANTLATTNNNANNPTGAAAGANADLASGNTLTKVVVAGGANFGAAAGIVAAAGANLGLTDRAVQNTGDNAANVAANDRGITAGATAANLVSLSNTVTTYDATAATGAQNVMFTAKASGVETNVTFIGGTGNDYVEFQVGNINATGGEGSDTFAFVNTGFNSTFTTADTIVGGAGTDTIQLGLNGVAGIDVQWTEFNSKTGVDVLDLRANINKVELSDAFVAAADVAGGMVVRTDKIVQTSAASVANPTGGSTVEDASVNTIILTKLASNRVITFEGGSGSDRLVLNEQSFTSNATLKGGDNVNNAGPSVAAVAADYDTLTVVDNSVLSRGDLSKTSGFEGLNLVKSDTTSGRQFSIELTEAFLLANTLAADNNTVTNIDDRAFQIGSVAAANGNALNNLDTVTIDVTDLFTTNNNTLKTSLTGRYVDLTSLNASGATVRFNYNGQSNLTQAQLVAAVANAAVVTTADVGGTANVLGGVAVPGVITGVVYASGIGAQATLGTNNNDTFTLTQADTVTGGTGADTVTFNAGSAAATVTLGAGADTANVNVALTNAANGLNMTAGGTVNIGADISAGAAYNMNGVAAAYVFGAATTVNVTVAQTQGVSTFTMENGAGHTLTSSVAGNYTLGTGGQTFTSSGTGAIVVAGGTGADAITIGSTGGSTVTAAGGIDTITLTASTGVDRVVVAGGTLAAGGVAAVEVGVAADRDVVTGFNAVNDIIVLTATATTAGTAAGATPVVQSVGAAGATLLSNTSDVTVFNFDMGGATNVLAGVLDGAALIANTGALTVGAATNGGYIVAYDGGNAYIYSYDADFAVADTNVTAAEINLIGTFNGVAVGALGVANFALV